MSVERCSSFRRCIGFLDGRSCPYARSKEGYCRIHAAAKNTLTRRQAPCSICLRKNETKRFECEKHAFCIECIAEASEFETCPICLSLVDDGAAAVL